MELKRGDVKEFSCCVLGVLKLLISEILIICATICAMNILQKKIIILLHWVWAAFFFIAALLFTVRY